MALPWEACSICLKPKVFEIIDHQYVPHIVDLFATRDNWLLDRYVSWRSDPKPVAIDTFMILLTGKNPYCFLWSLAFLGYSERCLVNR